MDQCIGIICTSRVAIKQLQGQFNLCIHVPYKDSFSYQLKKTGLRFTVFFFPGKNPFGEKERSYIEGSEILGISFQGVDNIP